MTTSRPRRAPLAIVAAGVVLGLPVGAQAASPPSDLALLPLAPVSLVPTTTLTSGPGAAVSQTASGLASRCDLDGDGTDDVVVAQRLFTGPGGGATAGAVGRVTAVRGGPGLADGPLPDHPRATSITGTTRAGELGRTLDCVRFGATGPSSLIVSRSGPVFYDPAAPGDRDVAYVIRGGPDAFARGARTTASLGAGATRLVDPPLPSSSNATVDATAVGLAGGAGERVALAIGGATSGPWHQTVGVLDVAGSPETVDVQTSDRLRLRIRSGSGAAVWIAGSPGDVDCDGVGDLAVFANPAAGDGDPRLRLVVISGAAIPATGSASLDLDGVAASATTPLVVRIPADAGGTIEVAGAGDQNGDGRDDLVLGTPDFRGAGAYDGRAYVVLAPTVPATVDLAALGGAGYAIGSAGPDARTGDAVGSTADLNGDGRPELLIGSPELENPALPAAIRSSNGALHVVYGKASTDPVDLATLPASRGTRLLGTRSGQSVGSTVAGLGDVDGDGTPDLGVGRSVDLLALRTGPGPHVDLPVDPPVRPPLDPPASPGPGTPLAPAPPAASPPVVPPLAKPEPPRTATGPAVRGRVVGGPRARRSVTIAVSRRLGARASVRYRVELVRGSRIVAIGSLRDRTLRLTVRNTAKKGRKASYARLRGDYRLRSPATAKRAARIVATPIAIA